MAELQINIEQEIDSGLISYGHTLILLGVDASEKNIIDKESKNKNVIYEYIRSCPPCGKTGIIEEF